MTITMEFIDRNGWWRKFQFESKKKAIKFLKALHSKTEIRWTSPTHVIVSQQYMKEGLKND